jgi:hypothetical protein
MAAIQYDTLTIKIKHDSAQVTKADESIIMDNLYKFFKDKQLYLTDLFTNRLTEWTASCIKADVCPDVYAEWMYAKGGIEDKDNVIRERNQQIHKLTLEANELKLTIGERDAGIESDAVTICKLKDQVTDVAEERDELAAGVLIYAEEAEEHANEINKLKAQLWDIMKEQLIREWGTGGV